MRIFLSTSLVVSTIMALSLAAQERMSGTQATMPSPGEQVEQSLATTDGGAIPYLLYQPKRYDADGAKVPLMLFLHGRGESHGPLNVVAKWGPPRRLAAGEHMKYLVVSPQCPRSSFWSKKDQQVRLLELLAHITKTYNVDTDRIYLTGLSMGGYGTWRLAADHPSMFAAAIPVCGAGDPKDGAKLTDVPIWAWHGAEDRTVPHNRSVEMVEAIKAAGGKKIRFTSLAHIGHASWQAAYQSADLYAWLDKHRASNNQK